MAEKKYQTKEEMIAEHGQAFGVKTEKEGWYGMEMQTKPSDPMVDSGTGKPYVLRTFEFAKNLSFKGTLTKQEIFNMHWRQIQTFLWGDGLVAHEDVNPRIVIGKKKYRIFILCKPRLMTIVVDKPQTLQEIFKPKSNA